MDNTYIARVPRKTVSIDQLLDLVAAHNQGIDRYQIKHAAELLKKEILEQASIGFSVDVIGICKLYIAPKGGVKSLTPSSEVVTGFEPRFVANDAIKKSLAKASATVTSLVESSPQISQIINPLDNTVDEKLKSTFSARLKGKKLKVAGVDCGIFFVPLDDKTKQASIDENSWIKVEEGFITTNTNTCLEFHLPRTLEAAKQYFIAVKTSVSNGKVLKKALFGISKIPITIEA